MGVYATQRFLIGNFIVQGCSEEAQYIHGFKMRLVGIGVLHLYRQLQHHTFVSICIQMRVYL